MSLEVANTILEQLGGKRFALMTGSKNFIGDKDSLTMTLVRNKSGANRLKITLDFGSDTYIMRFYKFSPSRYSTKKQKYTEQKEKDVYVADDVYCDMLQEIFTNITGLDTRLF